MKTFLESHFTLVMFIALLLGILLPGADKLGSGFVTILLATLIFLSCFKITVADIKVVSIKQGLLFYSLRFLVLPLLVYSIFSLVLPSFATSVLLFSLMPSGTAAPAITNLIGGNIALTLFIVCLSSLLAPVAIPGVFMLLGNDFVTLNSYSIFRTLTLVIFVPMACYLLLKDIRWIKRKINLCNKATSTLLVALIVFVVISTSRELIFQKPVDVATSLLVLSALFILFYLSGWCFIGRSSELRERATMAACSGINNNALGAGLALLHFSPEVALFMALSEVPWVISISVFKRIVSFKLSP